MTTATPTMVEIMAGNVQPHNVVIHKDDELISLGKCRFMRTNGGIITLARDTVVKMDSPSE